MLDDALHFFVDQFNAAQGRFFETADLALDEQLEGDFGNEESGSRAVGVSGRKRRAFVRKNWLWEMGRELNRARG